MVPVAEAESLFPEVSMAPEAESLDPKENVTPEAEWGPRTSILGHLSLLLSWLSHRH